MNLKEKIMKYVNYLAVGLAAAVLSACGGGGGGGNSVSSTSTNTQSPAAVPAKKVPLGGFYSFVRTSPTAEMKGEMIDETGEINILKINGQSIELLPEGFASNQVNLSDSKMIKAVGATQYARYGMYVKKDTNGNWAESTVFYQGQITPEANMPATGKATYHGSAFYNDAKLTNETGSSRFDVDFGQKTINGRIFSDKNTFDAVELKGKVSGNRFLSGDVDKTNTMSGAFYGPKAEEIAGRFDIPSRAINGTFGAKK